MRAYLIFLIRLQKNLFDVNILNVHPTDTNTVFE